MGYVFSYPFSPLRVQAILPRCLQDDPDMVVGHVPELPQGVGEVPACAEELLQQPLEPVVGGTHRGAAEGEEGVPAQAPLGQQEVRLAREGRGTTHFGQTKYFTLLVI